ncbi:DUF2937 family protein [Rhodospirillum rubrum]|nr:DUF2937 family protein [Rhodospirillum rubrum]AEO46756.1 hypothetical protein F11_01430 [Rhodospirillum rubrum F11]
MNEVMSWIVRKIDMLTGAVLASAAGMALSQTRAFITQYLQRLGGHLDEARLSLDRALGLVDPGDAGARMVIEGLRLQGQARLAELESAYRAIATADVWTQPLVFLRHADWSIAEATARAFEPALPLSTESLVFTLSGVVLALVIYEILKAPFALAGRGARRRRKVSSHPTA